MTLGKLCAGQLHPFRYFLYYINVRVLQSKKKPSFSDYPYFSRVFHLTGKKEKKRNKTSFKSGFNAVALPGRNNIFKVLRVLLAAHSVWGGVDHDHWVQPQRSVGGQPWY